MPESRRSRLPEGSDVGGVVQKLATQIAVRAEQLERTHARLRQTELRVGGLRDKLEHAIAVAEARLQSASSRKRKPTP